jgi:putative oxidoreductase
VSSGPTRTAYPPWGNVMRAFGSFMGRVADLGPLALRIGVGLVFALHGWQKFTEIGVGNFAGFLDSLGVPLADVVAPVQAFVELAAGILLILGLFTRFSVLPLIVISLGAMWLVKTEIGFLTPLTNPDSAGAELDAALLAGELCLLFIGPGRYALDAMLGWEATARHAVAGGRKQPPVAA